tara:strand:- start:1457 stop:1567 length:111 start_codon:yes stop_codon:yes gene_type:complete
MISKITGTVSENEDKLIGLINEEKLVLGLWASQKMI